MLDLDVGEPGDVVALNVTITRPVGAGFLSAWPCGITRPTTSVLNYQAGQSIPNLVVMAAGTDGKICFAADTATDLVVDRQGQFASGGGFVGMAPVRVLDSRV